MFGINDGCDSICVCHKFKVGVFDIVFFDVGAMMLISIAGIGIDVQIVVKIVVKIVVIVTVSFLNFIFPFNLV